MSQLEMKFATAQSEVKTAAEASAQLTICETETNIALRFSFRVPVYTAKGMLKDWVLAHVAISNVISLKDFGAPKSEAGFGYDANKLADLFKDDARKRLIKRHNLNERQAELVEFRGLSVARHFACTKVEVGDARWI